MTTTVADQLLARLREWGVEHVFGYPGDGINGILGAFSRADDRPRFIQSRHEEMSAFEAVGYAKFSGRPGVCLATSGPGAIHLLNGLYDAKLDHVPVVAIVGQTNRTAMGGSYQQEVDLPSLFKDVACDYVQMVTVPEQLPNVVDRAIRIAMTRRAPTALIIPNDVQELEYERPATSSRWCRPASASAGRRSSADEDARPSRGRRPQRGLAGSRSWSARAPAGRPPRSPQVADLLGAGVAKALLGKDVLSDELPWVTGSIGLLGTRPSYEMMRDCDTLLTVGSSFPYTSSCPSPARPAAVQIDLDGGADRDALPLRGQPRRGRRHHPAGAAPPAAAARRTGPGRTGSEREVDEWWEPWTRRRPSPPTRSTRCGSSTSSPRRRPTTRSSRPTAGRLPTGTRGTCGCAGDMRGSLSGTLATHGAGGALRDRREVRAPRPAGGRLRGRRCHADERARRAASTIARYWREWEDPRLVVAVLHNNDLNQVTWELRAMGGTPEFVESQALPDISYADFAAADRPRRHDDHGSGAARRRLGSTRSPPTDPRVLDIHCDPDIPPIPPHATLEQMTNVAKALIKGDTSRWGVIKEGVRTKAQESPSLED